jgi:hypothetical protein
VKGQLNVAFIGNTGGKTWQEVAHFPVITTEQAMAPTEPEREWPTEPEPEPEPERE